MGFYDDYKYGTDGDNKAKFWKCIAITLIIVLVVCLLVQCVTVIHNKNEISTTNNVTVEEPQFKAISKNLVYDVETNIVYIKNNISNTYSIYTPYYSTEGIPYRYDIETKTFK